LEYVSDRGQVSQLGLSSPYAVPGTVSPAGFRVLLWQVTRRRFPHRQARLSALKLQTWLCGARFGSNSQLFPFLTTVRAASALVRTAPRHPY
jgi:hypothetical protein